MMRKNLLEKIKGLWSIWQATWRNFYRHGGPMMAASISFYFLLSFVPMLLFAFSLVALLFNSPQKAYEITVSVINTRGFFPDGTVWLQQFVESFVAQAKIFNKISFVLLFIFSGGVFLTIESAINRVFERQFNRPLWRQIVFAYLLMILTYLFLVGSFLVTWSFIMFTSVAERFLGVTGFYTDFFYRVLPIVGVVLYFVLVYKIIPHCWVSWTSAIVSGIFAGVMWEIAKHLFSYYILYVARLNEIYGGISAVFASLLWVFYTGAIMLLGAEMASFITRRKLEGMSYA